MLVAFTGDQVSLFSSRRVHSEFSLSDIPFYEHSFIY